MDTVTSPDALDDADRERLQCDFPRWRIWRTRGDAGHFVGWVATRLLDDDVEPVIHTDTAADLEARLRSPHRRCGRVLSEVQRRAILALLERS